MFLLTGKQWLMILISLAAIAINGCGQKSGREVVAYVSVDRIYAEPILEKFSQETGIKVLPVYDVEATKTTGLANRLLLEKNRPQADVFWSGEFVQTLMLQENNVLVSYVSANGEKLPVQYRDPQGYWYGIGGRARVLLANTEKLEENQYPQSLTDLVSLTAGGQSAGIAYPIFGTSATHAAALYAHWGNDQAEEFYRDLQEQGVRVVDGNSVVRDLVVNGQLAIGLMDTDDACSAVAKGEPVEIILPDQGQGQMGSFVFAGTVALIANGPHKEAGQALVDFLTDPSTEVELIKAGGSQLPLYPSSPVSTCLKNLVVKPMEVNPAQVFEQLETSKRDLQTIFVR